MNREKTTTTCWIIQVYYGIRNYYLANETLLSWKSTWNALNLLSVKLYNLILTNLIL